MKWTKQDAISSLSKRGHEVSIAGKTVFYKSRRGGKGCAGAAEYLVKEHNFVLVQSQED